MIIPFDSIPRRHRSLLPSTPALSIFLLLFRARTKVCFGQQKGLLSLYDRPAYQTRLRCSPLHPIDQSINKMMEHPLRSDTELRQSLVVQDGDHCDDELTLEIKAPTDLPEGYNLRVQHQDSKITVKIPNGGVDANQVFRVKVRKPESAPPVGHWKDGLLDIFRYGPVHPHALTALACSLCT